MWIGTLRVVPHVPYCLNTVQSDYSAKIQEWLTDLAFCLGIEAAEAGPLEDSACLFTGVSSSLG